MKKWKTLKMLSLNWNGNPVDLESAIQIIERLDEKVRICYEKNELNSQLLADCKKMQAQLEGTFKREGEVFRYGLASGIIFCIAVSLIKYFLGF
jgi:hypothetical protein